ncbi:MULTISPECIES: stationary phase inducible protein CsiE [unclassified Erwinia]|uniref:stationary phase inducible protein CsiE n=1 Tax=unclassified Erwinia TaxID=2622719 RepID=UPI00092F279B|nr:MULTISPECIES: stationary phase inducible protein CsiE [unclassified Erwinia]
MMSEWHPAAAILSSPQRRSQLILMLCLPGLPVTLASVCRNNGVDDALARQDIAEVAQEIQRYHRLAIAENAEGQLALSGTPLDQRLCLLHGLRRALRLSPDFVQGWFAQQLRQHLLSGLPDKALYDERNLGALIAHAAKTLTRQFSERDGQLMLLYLQYALVHRSPLQLTPAQQRWLAAKNEYTLALQIVACWQKRGWQATGESDAAQLALLFSQLHMPSAAALLGDHERQLHAAVEQLIANFEQLAGMRFHHPAGLSEKLYSHLAQALERGLFGIGIDGDLTEDIASHYPRLMRTTRAALAGVEQQYGLQFSSEELGLVAVIFGAWLMQDGALQEKQVLLLTGDNPQLEQQIERQLRELTLLPIAIRYLDVVDFQRSSAPKGIALVITPYATPLPLYSPPLIHAELPLGEHQQLSIRALLES